MIGRLKQLITSSLKVFDFTSAMQKLGKDLDELRFQNEQILCSLAKNRPASLTDIQKAEFKVFSQFGNDGIIQFLILYLDIDTIKFINLAWPIIQRPTQGSC